MTQAFPGIYAFYLFKPQTNLIWIEELTNFAEFAKERELPNLVPNNMNNYGILLDDINYETML